jgi:hypothetical protein
VETEAERFLGSFEPKEYNILSSMKLPNGGRLNRVFEQMGVPYGPRPLPGTEVSQTAIKKQKAEVSKKLVAKRMKAM